MNIMFVSPTTTMKNGASRCYAEIAKSLVAGNQVISVFSGEGELKDQLEKTVNRCFVVEECGWCWACEKKYNISGLKKIKYYLRKLQNYLQVFKCINIICQNNIDIVYINTSTSYIAALAAKITGKPLVWHIRELIDEGLQSEFVDVSYSVNLLEYASKQICISKAVENKFKNKYGLSKTCVIYDGVDIERFYCKRDIFASEKIGIFIFGRIVKTKGQLLLLKAINELKNEYNNLECKVIGPSGEDEDYNAEVMKFVSDNGLASIVHFTGYVENPEDYMRKADIVCVCSDAEGFGLVTVEAMLSGALVIGSDSGCTAELLDKSKYGLLYEKMNHQDLCQKIKYALQNKDIMQNIAIRAQEYATEFSVENNVKAITKILVDAAKQ